MTNQGSVGFTVGGAHEDENVNDDHVQVDDEDDLDALLNYPGGHKPRRLFVEMEELRHYGNQLEWKETARWVKFEEEVEEEGNRWSKPFVSTLSMHSLLELRKGIENGVVLLDIQATTLQEVISTVLDNMDKEKLSEKQRMLLFNSLMQKHHHQFGEAPTTKSMGRSLSDKKLQGKTTRNKGSDIMNKVSGSKNDISDGGSGHLTITKSNSSAALGLDKQDTHFNSHFAKKIDKDAESCSVWFGELDFVDHTTMAFVRLDQSLVFTDLMEVPVPTRFFFFLLCPAGNWLNNREIGRSMATIMAENLFHKCAYRAKNRHHVVKGIDVFLEAVTVLPPGEWDPNQKIEPPKKTADAEPEEEGFDSKTTLERTHKLFGGLCSDIKRKFKFFGADIKQGFHIQSLASFVFMYFACLSTLMTFGGLMSSELENNMGPIESLLSGAICGISYAVFSGQPLTIISSTGPMLIFETIVYHLCHDYHISYMSFRFWIGMWVAGYLLLIVMFDLSTLVRYITRFTEESFAGLIALIFIIEAFKKMFAIGTKTAPVNLHPLEPLNYSCSCIEPEAPTESPFTTVASNATAQVSTNWTAIHLGIDNLDMFDVRMDMMDECTDNGGELDGVGCTTKNYVSDVFFFSCLLFIATFALVVFLKQFRTERCFSTAVRSQISNFAVAIAILSMTGLDYGVGLATPKLYVPQEFVPTDSPNRGWIINPFLNPWWVIPIAAGPAILAVILIFMDQQITAVIVNRRENKLQHSCGYHLDLFIVAIQIVACSVLGTPWFVAATMESMNHVNSLHIMSDTAAPGEKPKFLGIREQRLTGFLVFVLVGCSVFFTQVLVFVPMPVLYGVFFFMGYSSLGGLELVNRIFLVLTPKKYQPEYHYIAHVRLGRIHCYTLIQVCCVAALIAVKTVHSIAIIFPIMVLAMCFIRKALDWVFTVHELEYLDDLLPGQGSEIGKLWGDLRRDSMLPGDAEHGHSSKSSLDSIKEEDNIAFSPDGKGSSLNALAHKEAHNGDLKHRNGAPAIITKF